tara:strand:+ start:44 stop:244 length:201 start_codon:yes stop_codon:yes gene_type:complete
MPVWLPVLFVCLTNGKCDFYAGDISVSVAQCAAQNAIAERLIKGGRTVEAYQMACIEIKPKVTDSV